MLVENLTADPWLAEIWSLALVAENHVPEVVCHLAVLFPPCTDRVHVVGRSRTYRKIRIVRRMSECLFDRLRHALDLERKDSEIIHHLRHCSRDHSEVLTAGKHSCRIEKSRELLHRLILPELVVSTVEEVIVETVESGTAVCVKHIVRLSLLCADLRMVMSLLPRILKEKSEIVHIESLSLELVCRERKRRVEVTVQTALCPERNLPDTEETENVVDTECIEILGHLGKT